MFGKLLWVAVLAGSALAQVIIKHPVRGADVAAGAAFTIQLGIPASTTGQVTEVAIAIGASACFAGCRNDGLGFDVLYSGVFNPQSTDNAGDEYQNITVTAPNYFDGEMLLSVAHFYLQGERTNTPELQLTNTTLNLIGASG